MIHPVFARVAKKVINIFSSTAHLSHCKGFLDLVSDLSGIEVMCLSSKELCTLLLYGHSDLSVRVNHGLVEGTMRFFISTGRFEKY